MSPIIISFAAFVGVTALVAGVAMLLRGDENRVVEERLQMLTGSGGRGHAMGNAPTETSLLLEPLDDRPSLLEELFARFGSVKLFLEQADSPIDSTRLLLLSVVLAAGGFAGCTLLHAPLVLAPFAAILLAGGPFGWLFLRRKRRLTAFGRQLPEALELISRALRAGHSLAAGFSLVAEEMAEPIGKEFGRCYEQQNLGIPLDEALEEMTERVPNLDVRFFATAVILQRQTGGDLAEILDKIGGLVRERFKIWGQIQALTGEGRLSGIVLLALPPALFAAMYKLNPEYSLVLFRDPLGHKMLTAAVIFQIVGAFVIRKIINIKV